jgi:hypothetical protein
MLTWSDAERQSYLFALTLFGQLIGAETTSHDAPHASCNNTLVNVWMGSQSPSHAASNVPEPDCVAQKLD